MNKWIRLTVLTLVMALLLSLTPGTAYATQADSEAWTLDDLTATQVVVYNTATGEYLLEAGYSSGKVYPASITKLFTSFVALQYLSEDTRVTAGSELSLVGEGSSVAVINQGETLTVSQLVEGLLLPSGNDAAYVLATAAGRAIAGDSGLPYKTAIKVFVDEMNRTARILGLKDTHFMNPDGYHVGGHYSSLRDLVKIGQLSMENPVISRCVRIYQDDVVYKSGQDRRWKNTNELIHPDSKYYLESACGLKTGFTSYAGNCLLSAIRQEEGYLIIGVFGCPGEYDRFRDTIGLAKYYG